MRNEPQPAAAELRIAIGQNPDDPEAHLYLGRALAALGKDAVGRNPPANLYRGRLRKEEIDAQFATARSIYKQMFAGLSNLQAHGPGGAAMHIGFGFLLLYQSREEDALEQFRWAAALDPRSDVVHRSVCQGLGESALLHSPKAAQKEFDEAVSECELAVTLGPGRTENRLELAYVLAAQGKLDEAQRVEEEAVQLAPNSPSVRFVLGTIYEQERNYTAAADAYRNAIALAPDNAELHRQLAGAFRRQQDRWRDQRISSCDRAGRDRC